MYMCRKGFDGVSFLLVASTKIQKRKGLSYDVHSRFLLFLWVLLALGGIFKDATNQESLVQVHSHSLFDFSLLQAALQRRKE